MEIMKYSNMKYAHHHVHSEYSPLDAPIHLKQLVSYARELGYKALTITDHGTISSWVKFAQYCKEAEVKPIFGIEAYFVNDITEKGKRDNHHQIMIAKNDEGLKNLCRLSEIAQKEGFHYDPRIDWKLLEQYGEGLILTSSCVSGIIPETYEREGHEAAKRVAERFQKQFGDDFYMEVQYHNLDIEKNRYGGVAKIAQELGIKLVGTNDVHYLRKPDCLTQEVMQTLRMQRCIKDPDRMKHEQTQLYLKSQDEMVDVFGGKDKQAVVSTMEIVEKCNAKLAFGKVCLPSLQIPKEYKTDFEYLDSKARLGMKRIGKENDPIYEERYAMELGVVKTLRDKGLMFDRYFLIVEDYVSFAKSKGIRVGVGRGSGAGSLLLYCLGITGIDPLKYDLLFERFLAEDRNEMPDIDIDFDAERREEVFTYLCEKYGIERVVKIGTVGAFKVPGAIKSAIRVFDLGNDWEAEQRAKQVNEQTRELAKTKNSKRAAKKDEPKSETSRLANEYSKLLPRGIDGKNADDKLTLLKSVAEKDEDRILVYDHPECGEAFRNFKKKYPEVMAFAESIEGLAEKRGCHAAGILITDEPTRDRFPCQRSGKSEADSGHKKANKIVEYGTAFDMGDIDKLGGVKFDVLGVKVLSVITRTLQYVGSKWSWPFDIDNIPDDDADVLKVFGRGDTLAVFQFESPGMQKLLKDMKPNRFEDLIAANALYRPGPMDQIPLYIRRKHGIEPLRYPAESTIPVLGLTYGVMVYQEQVMKMTKVLASFTGSEADKVRKAMGKKKKDILTQMKEKFIKGCHSNKTCPEATADLLWDQMEKFGAYGFNKSHSAGYAYNAYQCGWLKHYFPAEYMSAQVTIEGNDGAYDDVKAYENSMINMGIKISPLDINKSKADYTVEAHNLVRRGFTGTKGIGESAYDDIVAGQPYKDMYDYCFRAGNGVQSGVVKVMIEAGAFDWLQPKLATKFGMKPSRSLILKEYEDQVTRARSEKKVKGAAKEERDGIGFVFDVEEENNLAGNFSL